MMYECPKCGFISLFEEFTIQEDGKYAQCPKCAASSLTISIERYIPPAKEGTIDITPEGYSTMAKAIKLSRCHARTEKLKERALPLLRELFDQVQERNIDGDTFDKVEQYIHEVDEAQNDLISAVCGR